MNYIYRISDRIQQKEIKKPAAATRRQKEFG